VTSPIRQILDELHPSWQELPFDKRLQAESVLLEDPTTQRSHAIGRYATPTFTAARLYASAIVLGSDGACLGEFVASGGNLVELADWLDSVERRQSRDDLICMVVIPTISPMAAKADT
jgi:hypothetical protein